jgi:hypothetical protein
MGRSVEQNPPNLWITRLKLASMTRRGSEIPYQTTPELANATSPQPGQAILGYARFGDFTGRYVVVRCAAGRPAMSAIS